MSQLEDLFAFQLRALGIKFEREVRFCETRHRLDFVVEGKLAVEIQGGTYIQGGHSRGKAQANDARKNYLALKAGYRILYLTTDHIKSGLGVKWLQDLLAMH